MRAFARPLVRFSCMGAPHFCHNLGAYMPKKAAPKRGPKPQLTKPEGLKFEEAIQKALSLKKPASGWPKAPTKAD